MLILRRRMPKQLASWLVSPLLYFTAFTCAMGGVTVNGLPYIDFLVPGLVAMASMTQAWAIAVDINIARFYWHMLDEFMTCPLSASGYVAGETAAGIVRAMGASVIIMIIGTLAGVHVNLLAPGLWLALVLNAWFFSGLAIMMAMLVKSHADQALLSNFVITPMAFLGGTFFPLERLPEWARHLLGRTASSPRSRRHAGSRRGKARRLVRAGHSRHWRLRRLPWRRPQREPRPLLSGEDRPNGEKTGTDRARALSRELRTEPPAGTESVSLRLHGAGRMPAPESGTRLPARITSQEKTQEAGKFFCRLLIPVRQEPDTFVPGAQKTAFLERRAGEPDVKLKVRAHPAPFQRNIIPIP